MTTTSPEMDPFEGWVVEDAAFATDGGSIYLQVRASSGAAHKITLWQHLFTDVRDPQRLPGRLYLDGSLVPVRSKQESKLLGALRGASLAVAGRASGANGNWLSSSPGVVVGRDIEEYLSKIEEGPAAAVAHLVVQLIEYIESEGYVALARKLEES